MYATSESSPDPSLVRGAIFRLARESELQRESIAEARHLLAAQEAGEATGHIFENSSAKRDAPGHAAVGLAQMPAFGDVARRVWEGAEVGNASAQRSSKTGASAENESGKNESGKYERSGLRDAAFRDRSQPVAPDMQTEIEHPAETEEGRASFLTAEAPTADQTVVAVFAQMAGGKTLAGAPTAPQSSRCDAEKEPALAHDACNLLSAVGLYSELLGSPGVLDEHHRHYAEELRLLAGRSQVLIDRLLRGSAAEDVQAPSAAPQPTAMRAGDFAGGSEEVQRTSLADLLMRWGSLLSTLAHGTLEVVLGPNASTPVPAGAEAVERILVNLVRNARAATVAGGAIRIAVRVVDSGKVDTERLVEGQTGLAAVSETVPARTMVLTVDDSGCGMTEDQVQQIFGTRRAQEADSVLMYEARVIAGSDGYGRWPGNGHYLRESAPEQVERKIIGDLNRRQGLGLQIVRELVEGSRGALSIQSCPGMGTRIEIRWPVVALATDVTPATETYSQQLTHGGREAQSAISSEAEPELIEPGTIEPGTIEPGTIEPGTIEPGTIESGTAIAAQEILQTTAIDEQGPAVGPDGFSESELRAMILRLQRGVPQKRSLFSRRIDDRRLGSQIETNGRPVEDRMAVERIRSVGPLSDRPEGAAEADYRFGAMRSGAGGGLLRNSTMPQESTRKGAIAC